MPLILAFGRWRQETSTEYYIMRSCLLALSTPMLAHNHPYDVILVPGDLTPFLPLWALHTRTTHTYLHTKK